jgi:uncharacterized protein
MQDERFEWDDAKAAANFGKHGVEFAYARPVFADRFALEKLDQRRDYGEVRSVITGRVGSEYLTVAFTVRSRRFRLISARTASAAERRRYDGRDDKS